MYKSVQICLATLCLSSPVFGLCDEHKSVFLSCACSVRTVFRCVRTVSSCVRTDVQLCSGSVQLCSELCSTRLSCVCGQTQYFFHSIICPQHRSASELCSDCVRTIFGLGSTCVLSSDATKRTNRPVHTFPCIYSKVPGCGMVDGGTADLRKTENR